MKKKILIITTALVIVLGGYLFIRHTLKVPYDYSDYYVKKDTIDNYCEEDETVIEEKETELSLPLLKATNSDVVGIIEFDQRAIYEPVAQAPDNKYYERRNFAKEYSAAGIPFVTSEGNIDSTNVVIYGHSSKRNSIIFTPLMNYVDVDYYHNHPTFKFVTENDVRTYLIFTILNINLNNLEDSLEFTQSEWRSDNDYLSFINNSISNSLYNTNVSVNTNDKLMSLVTCDTRDNSKRIVVIAKLVQDE